MNLTKDEVRVTRAALMDYYQLLVFFKSKLAEGESKRQVIADLSSVKRALNKLKKSNGGD